MNRCAGTLKLMFLETRPQFLTLVPCVISVGVAMAVNEGYFNALHMVLAVIGTMLAHASVNIFNDYADWRRGTDKLVRRTPFSGGSGLLPSGALTERQVLWLGVGCLAGALAIGAYFVSLYPMVFWVIAGGTVLVLLYTPILTKVYITEVFPGLGLGMLPIIGAYITQLPPHQAKLPASVVWASIPAGILVSGLLWLNELPDFEADGATGRRHGVLFLGRKRAAVGYVVLLILTYVFIVVPVALKTLPWPALLGLLTMPLALKASLGALASYDKHEEIIPVLGQNVITVLATPVLMAIGVLLANRF
jgi:1,4-dihydroxy-2-naphthoate octaprenyltransferase